MSFFKILFPKQKSQGKVLTNEQLKDIQASFQMFDLDGSGSISRSELYTMLQRFGGKQDMTTVDIDSIINRADSNNDGEIDFNEFVVIMSTQIDGMGDEDVELRTAFNMIDIQVDGMRDEDVELRTAFNMIDTDSSGSVAMAELKVLLANANLLMTDDELDLIMDECDVNGDGELDFEEFKQLMTFDLDQQAHRPQPPDVRLNQKSLISFLPDSTSKDERPSWWNFRLSPIARFYLCAIAAPLLMSLVYSAAIFFPPEARAKSSLFLWTDGHLIIDSGKAPILCPAPLLCSEGVSQIIMVAIARLAAFASYAIMGLTFVSKMHSSLHYLSSTYLSNFVPFEHLHDVNSKMGMMYTWLIFAHTLAHLVRWGLRNELSYTINTRVGLSGAFGMFLMMLVTFSMTLAKRFASISFERRFINHWAFTLLVVALCFHNPRCRIVTSIFL